MICKACSLHNQATKMSSNKEKISIIVPVYNSEIYLGETVNSLINQTYTNLEILLIDDGSSDDSWKICQHFALVDKRVIAITQKNQGVSVARNAGIFQASGQYITFVDADDWVEETMCEQVLAVANESKADIVIWPHFNDSFAGTKKTETIKLLREPIEENFSSDVSHLKEMIQLKVIARYYQIDSDFAIKGNGTVWGKLYRKAFIDENNLQFVKGIIRSQDTLFNVYAFEYAKKIVYLKAFLYHYRMSESSTTSVGKYISGCSVPFSSLLNEYQKFIVTYGKSADFMEALQIKTLIMLHLTIRHDFFNPSNSKKKSLIYKELIKLIDSQPYHDALRKRINNPIPFKYKLMKAMLRLRMFTIYRLMHNTVENLSIAKNRHYK